MRTGQGTLTKRQAVELVQAELNMSYLDALKWVEKTIGAAREVNRSVVIAKIRRIKSQLRSTRGPWEDETPEEELSL